MKFDYTAKIGSDGFFSEESDVHEWCKAMGIKEYTYAYSDFHQAMALSTSVDVNLVKKLDQLIQLPVRFERVNGHLWLNHNELTSLVGLPQTCKLIMLANNPLSFESLMPLSHIKELKLIYLPIELKKLIEKTGFKFYSSPLYISIDEQSISDFQLLLTEKEKERNEKNFQQKEYLKQNEVSLITLNKSFQQKTLYKYGKI